MKSDIDEVAERLSRWARSIRSSNLPSDMIDALADAFEAVAKVEAPASGRPIEQERAAMLGRSLAISKPIGRPMKSFPTAGLLRFLRFNPTVTETSLKAALKTAADISESCALSHIKRAKERIANGEGLLAQPLPDHLQTLLTSPGAQKAREWFGYPFDG